MFQRQVDAAQEAGALAAEARRLLRPRDFVDVDDADRLVEEAAGVYRAFRSRPDVAEILALGECLYEVPFSLESPDRPDERLRGAVDCVVLEPDGAATVVEFKTGKPDPAHEAQAGLYAEAISRALGLSAVRIRVLYA